MSDNDRNAISSLAQAMSPAERVAMVVRIVMLSKETTPDQLRNTITAMLQHAFAFGMTSAIQDQDQTRLPAQRFNDYMSTRNITKG